MRANWLTQSKQRPDIQYVPWNGPAEKASLRKWAGGVRSNLALLIYFGLWMDSLGLHCTATVTHTQNTLHNIQYITYRSGTCCHRHWTLLAVVHQTGCDIHYSSPVKIPRWGQMTSLTDTSSCHFHVCFCRFDVCVTELLFFYTYEN